MRLNSMFVALCLLWSGAVWGETAPQGTVVDARVRTLVYSDNQVYKITAYYGYQTDIELAANEDIRTVAAGDTVGWQIVTAGQHIFIKPMADQARTNMSVITSRRTYIFDLRAQAVSDRWDMTYLVRFKYPQASVFASQQPGRTTQRGAAELNFNYKVKGDKAIRPSRVFDDGQFTFFQFNNPRRSDLPAIFFLGLDGQESLVNYRMDGNYVVVERISEKYILRNGDEKVTVTKKEGLF
jgi:type IV secretion system protein VirB9